MLHIFLILVLILFFLLNKRKILLESFSNELKISVLILSYKRPWNLNKSIPKLLKFNNIDDITILHGNKDFKKEINHPRVKNIDDWDSNSEIYTMRRFKNINYCLHDNVLILDDDLIPDQELIDDLVDLYKKDKNNFYGPFRRVCGSDYKTVKYKKGVQYYNTILTGLILTSKKVVNNVWKEMIKNKNLYDKVVEQKGNCEDLFFNHIFKKMYNKTPIGVSKYNEKYYLDTKNGFKEDFNSKNLRSNFCKLINNL